MRVDHLYTRPLLALVSAAGLTFTMSGAAVAEAATRGGHADLFAGIAAVLQNPRCLNCHQTERPLQADSGRAHMPRVVRGQNDNGAGALRCANCHRQSNNADSGVPGAPHWQLAPLSMDWSGLSAAALCQSIKDPARNGGRSVQALVEHMERDALVRWGWEPGSSRAPVPVPHADFIDLLKRWVATGATCPT